MTRKRQFIITIQIFASLTIFCFIIFLASLLTGETTRFFSGLGKSDSAALHFAWALALLVPVASFFRSQYIWINGLRNFFIISLIGMNVWFASQVAVMPIISESMTEEDRVILSEIQKQLGRYDRQIETITEQIKALPESYRTRKSELTDKQTEIVNRRAVTLSELRTVSDKKTDAGIKDVFNSATVLALLFSRLAMEVGILFLSAMLKKIVSGMSFSDDSEPVKKDSDKTLTKPFAEFDKVEIIEKKPCPEISLQSSAKPSDKILTKPLQTQKTLSEAEKTFLDLLVKSDGRERDRKSITENHGIRSVIGSSPEIDRIAENLVVKGFIDRIDAEKKAYIRYKLRNGYGMNAGAKT